jgi:predicted dehydrogenase
MNKNEIGVIMNGVTGRMGTRQHLLRSILAIIKEGGIPLGNNAKLIPRPMLVGRNPVKLKNLAEECGLSDYTTDLDTALSDVHYPVYFDTQVTSARYKSVLQAIRAGKHIYCEKPTGSNLAEALKLYHEAEKIGVKHGVVQDKLFLPGLLKLKDLVDNKFFGRIFSVKVDFGYWVFEGHTIPANRPSWNYKKEAGGGLILDMFSHWRYVLDNLFAPVKSIVCHGATHIKERVDEEGNPYKCSADDTAYAVLELEGDVIVQICASWSTRVRRDDLLIIQVDGTKGSAVAGLRECYTQDYDETPVPVWNPDIPQSIQFYDSWKRVEDQKSYPNAFRAQWELFLRHVVLDSEFRWNLLEGAKGVQLAETALRSWQDRSWKDIEPLN